MDLYKFDDAHYLPSEQYPLHKQDTWELTYIVKGKGKRTIGDSVMEFGDGDLVFIPPLIPHFWDFDKDYTDDKGMVNHIALSFRTELLDRWSSAFPEFTERIEHLKTVSSGTSFDPATNAVIADCILKMREEKPSEYLPFVMRLILKIEENIDSTFVVGRASETDRASERLNKVRLFTTNNYARTITIDMVADHVGMNRSSFCTFFKKTTGQTYITYLNKLRVDRACNLLRQNNFSVTEVCYMVGFNDVPYFNRCFKNNRGMSPKEYAEGVMTKRQMLKTKHTDNDKRNK